MFNLTKNTINIINNSFVWCYRFLVIFMLLILILQSDSALNTIPLFNYLINFLPFLHKTPEIVSFAAEIQNMKETISLLSYTINTQKASILELINQIKEANLNISNLKQDILMLNNEYKQSLEVLSILINDLPTRITPVMPEILLPEINIKSIETLLTTSLEKQNTLMTNVFNKVNEFSQLQKIHLEQGKLSYNLLAEKLIIHSSNLNEIKNNIVAGNQSFINTLTTQTQNLLTNLSTSNLSNSINNQTSLLNQLIINQKNALSTTDFIKGVDTIQKDFITLNSNINDNGYNIKDISSTLTGLDFNFHNKLNNLDNKLDNINTKVNEITSIKDVKTEVQGSNSWTNWYNNKK